MTELICDFCSQPDPTFHFHCPDFEADSVPDVPAPMFRSKGDWVACAACAHSINTSNWNGLLERALERLGPKYLAMGMPRSVLANAIRHSHSLFRQHYQDRKEKNESC